MNAQQLLRKSSARGVPTSSSALTPHVYKPNLGLYRRVASSHEVSHARGASKLAAVAEPKTVVDLSAESAKAKVEEAIDRAVEDIAAVTFTREQLVVVEEPAQPELTTVAVPEATPVVQQPVVAKPLGSITRCPILGSPKLAPAASWDRSAVPAKAQVAALQSRPLVTLSRFFGSTAVLVGAQSVVREIITYEDDLTRSGVPASARKLLGANALSSLDGPRHDTLRKQLTGALSSEQMDGFLPEIQSVVGSYFESWSDTENTVLAAEATKRLALDISCRVILGLSPSEKLLNRLEKSFSSWTNSFLTSNTIDIFPLPFYFAMQGRKDILRIVNKRIEQLQAGEKVKPCVLASFLNAKDEKGQPLSSDAVADVMLELLYHGHATTSSGLTSMLALLFENPAALSKLQQEQVGVTAKWGKAIMASSLASTTYADAVIRETFRVQPVISSLMRTASTAFQVNGYDVTEGSQLMLGVGATSASDPRWATATDKMAPEKFNPDRFMGAEAKVQGGQMPWGLGSRSCIGAALALHSMKVFLFELARGQYSYSLDHETEWEGRVFPTPANGLPMFVKKLD